MRQSLNFVLCISTFLVSASAGCADATDGRCDELAALDLAHPLTEVSGAEHEDLVPTYAPQDFVGRWEVVAGFLCGEEVRIADADASELFSVDTDGDGRPNRDHVIAVYGFLPAPLVLNPHRAEFESSFSDDARLFGRVSYDGRLIIRYWVTLPAGTVFREYIKVPE